MEEILKAVYRDYLNKGEESQLEMDINAVEIKFDKAVNKFEDVLNEKLFAKMSESIYDELSELEEVYFMAGFNQCAKLMSKGKVDFFPNN